LARRYGLVASPATSQLAEMHDGKVTTRMLGRRSLGLALPGLLANGAVRAATRQIEFRILRDGRPIGSHRTLIEQSGTALTARIAVDIAVTLAGLTVFRFTQRFVEEWRDGRLLVATARRDRNGSVTDIQARAETDGVTVRGPAGSFRLSAEAAPLSWWDPDRFGRPLFATDTGEPLTRLVIRLAPLANGGRLIRVSGDGETESRYGADDAWLGWQSQAEDGSTIVYAPI